LRTRHPVIGRDVKMRPFKQPGGRRERTDNLVHLDDCCDTGRLDGHAEATLSEFPSAPHLLTVVGQVFRPAGLREVARVEMDGQQDRNIDGAAPDALGQSPQLFQSVDTQSVLSSGHLGMAVVLTIGTMAIMWTGISRWMAGGTLPLAVIWMPMSALIVWRALETKHGWSPSKRRLLTRIGLFLTLFFGGLFGYGLYQWQTGRGSAELPLFAAMYLALGLLSRGFRVTACSVSSP